MFNRLLGKIQTRMLNRTGHYKNSCVKVQKIHELYSKYYKDMKYRLHHHLSKFDWSIFLNLMPISNLFCYGLEFYLESFGVLASIREKAISTLAENLNSSRSYLITAVNCPSGPNLGLVFIKQAHYKTLL